MTVTRVTDYGATGDGTTDDRGAFVAAITAAGDGGLVLVPTPPVSYRCTQINVTKSVRIAGEGRRPLLHRAIGVGQNSSIVMDLRVSGITIENLAIDCHAVANFATCVHAEDCGDLIVRDCYLYSSEDPPPLFGNLAPTIYGVVFEGCNNVLVGWNTTHSTELKLSGASIGGVAGPGIRVLFNVGTNCHDAGISCVTFGDEECSDVLIQGNIMHDCYLGGIYVGSDGDTDVGGRFRRVKIVDNILSGHKIGPSGSIGIVARAGDVAEDWSIINNTIFPGAKLLPGERYAIGIDAKSTNTAGFFKRLLIALNQIHGADRWGIRATLFGGEVNVSNNQCEDDEGILVVSKAVGTTVVGGGNTSKPRGNHPGMRLQTLPGATMKASIGTQQLANPLSIVEADPGSITLEATGAPVNLTVAPSPLVIDDVAYDFESGDYGAFVNTQLALLDHSVWHAIVLRGERESATPLAFSGFTAGLDVDAMGLRILWSGNGSPIDFAGSVDVVVSGGRYRRAGDTEDLRFVATGPPGPTVETLGIYLTPR